MVDGIDPTTGQRTDGFGVVIGPEIEPESGVGKPYQPSPLSRGTEELGSRPDSLSNTPLANQGQGNQEVEGPTS